MLFVVGVVILLLGYTVLSVRTCYVKKKKRKKEFVFFLSQPVAWSFACMFANLVLGAFLTRSAKRSSPRGLERLGYVVFSLLLL